MNKQRILVIAHAHPDFSLGGGEIAAYNLFKAYRDNPQVEKCWFLGRVERGHAPSGNISRRREGEYLWDQGIDNFSMLTTANVQGFHHAFGDLLKTLRPTVVHAHHYVHMGIELFRFIKNIDPTIKILLTLHEYIAICRNNGQMIKTHSTKLCSQETAEDCHNCFPEFSSEDFWLRKHFIQQHFSHVDLFVSPSHFLKARYVNWGLDSNTIHVIENGQDSIDDNSPRPLKKDEPRNRFAFFGQINPYKGVDVLLKALVSMKKSQRKKIRLSIHGANLERQTDAFQQQIQSLSQPLINNGVLQWVGPYAPEDIGRRMKSCDWVVIPSIWWENSPMVIQEAFCYGKPVIASGIGGMAEKVHHGINGLLAEPNNAIDWADTLLRAATEPELWDKLYAGIEQPLSYAQCAQDHIHLIESGLST